MNVPPISSAPKSISFNFSVDLCIHLSLCWEKWKRKTSHKSGRWKTVVVTSEHRMTWFWINKKGQENKKDMAGKVPVFKNSQLNVHLFKNNERFNPALGRHLTRPHSHLFIYERNLHGAPTVWMCRHCSRCGGYMNKRMDPPLQEPEFWKTKQPISHKRTLSQIHPACHVFS